MSVRGPPSAKRRPELRYLRSDGKPNFSDRVHERESELEIIMRKDVKKLTPTETIGKAVKVMREPIYRRLPITSAVGEIVGVLTSSDVVNYLGGGEYYNIILKRHKGIIYHALEEPIATIMSKNVVYSYMKETIKDVLEKMIIYGVGVIPVVLSLIHI